MKYFLWFILFVFFLCTDAFPAAMSTQADDISNKKIVLILNAYRQEIEWSNELVKKIEEHFLPDQHVRLFSGNMNTDVALTPGTASLTLRSILWALVEDTQKVPDATSTMGREMFMNNTIPDALVFIGDESFMHYLAFGKILGKWQDIPVILCNVNDSIAAGGWIPSQQESFNAMWSIDDYRVIDSYIYKNSLDIPYISQNKKLWDTRKDSVVMGANCFRIRIDLNLSGVRVNTPVRENLELIHRMMPALEELTWIDNDYYQANYALKRLRDIMPEVMPEVRLSTMIHNRVNTDSIYDVMLEPAKNRAFITYSWNIDALYSRRSDDAIDSLFTHVFSVPLFTLTQRPFTDENYWVGGYYRSQEDIVKRTTSMIENVLNGTSANDIPFETVNDGSIILNETALKRYGLSKAAGNLDKVVYVHTPPNFYQRNEGKILISIIILAIIGGCVVYSVRRSRFNRQIERASLRYKWLYDKLQAIYKHSSIDFALYDEQGHRLVYIVDGQKVLGDEQADGLFSTNLFSGRYLNKEQESQIRKKQTVNKEITVDYRGKLSDYTLDEQQVYQLIVKPLHKSGYETISYMAIAIDLTPVVREQREKERFENLFHFASNSSQVGVAFYNIHTASGMASDSWYQNLNEPVTENMLPEYKSLEPEIRDRILSFRKRVLAGKAEDAFCSDARVTNAEGEQHWIRIHVFYVPGREQLIELNVNIDQQKQSEIRLYEAKQKAEKANIETGKFLSNISHEIRTPLNGIVGFSAVLAVTDEDAEEYIPIILRNNKLLKDIIDNVLDLSELDSGTVVFKHEAVDMKLLFAEMENYIRSNLYGKPLKVVADLPKEDTIVYTDYRYLHLLLMNLLSNAMKFTETGEIRIGYRKEETHSYFYIKDTGCGIPSEAQKRIFKRFEKLNSYMQGTGLGLALCKSIVEHLGGKIGVVSTPGEGSTFWFVLPLGR